MKKEELMKQYEELKGKGKEPEMIFLYIHMPTGETETIVNPNVEEKMKYIDRTYNEDLVHANCKDIYIEQAYICADFGPTMMFSDAYMLMKQGAKVKLPNWGGYWYWDAEKKTIMMHTKDGEELDIRQTERLERGVKVARKGWNGKGIYLEMQFPDEHSKMTQQYVYIVTTGLVSDNENAPKGIVPWAPSQTDMAAKDWVVFTEE